VIATWKLAVALAALAVVAGCATTSAPAPTTRPGTPATGTPTPPSTPVGQDRATRATRALNLTGFPPEYQTAYRDGCAAVGSATTTPPPGRDAQYTQGWKDGYTFCLKRPPR
jgi:hypothetical protein